jgi:hypothetical protein
VHEKPNTKNSAKAFMAKRSNWYWDAVFFAHRIFFVAWLDYRIW